MKDKLTICGAGLAGCEAAWQAAQRGVPVRLIEMKPEKYTPAHHDARFSELVCSNSLRSDRVSNAVGLLKEELRRLDSLIMEAAYASRVPAGSALAVDRHQFSEYITNKVKSHPNIQVVCGEVTLTTRASQLSLPDRLHLTLWRTIYKIRLVAADFTFLMLLPL